MSLIKIDDIAYVRFSVPDLGKAEAWFSDFGLVRANDSRRAARTESLFLSGTGNMPFVYWAERGERGFLGLGFKAEARADLKTLAAATRATIEALDAPGGGEVVRLADPDGQGVEIVYWPAEQRREMEPRAPLNTVDRRERLRAPKRLPSGPSQVVRLGHAVLNVTDFRRSEAWYKEHLGLLTSDEIRAGDGEAALGAFLRCDRGDQPTDHHTLFLLQGEKPGFNHAAFEVRDSDDLMTGHDHLIARKAAHSWGVGRHILGSQIFDYWRDPWGNTMEHWTDGDLFTAARPRSRP